MAIFTTHSDPEHFLPDFRRFHTVLTVTLTAELLAALLELASSPDGADFWSGLGVRALFILWIALTSAAMLSLLRDSLRNLSEAIAGLVALFVILTVTFLVSWLTYVFLPRRGIPLMPGRSPEGWFPYARNAGISSIVAVFFLRYRYLQFQWNKQTEAEAAARLDALQSRIRPHFLFNTLNTIAGLTRVDPALAEELVQDLAELFRANIKPEATLVPLRDELALAKQYLHIESQRLGQRLTIRWDVSGLPLNALMPPLCLQPLLENAVYHGIEPASEGGLIRVSGHLQRGKIGLVVKNTLPAEPLVPSRLGNRMALENVKARLMQFFAGEARLLISTVDECYQVHLIMPYVPEAPCEF